MFQSSPSLRRETPSARSTENAHPVSILSLLAEGDAYNNEQYHRVWRFNPLPPCGGRPARCGAYRIRWRFQSSPSLRRETGERREGGHETGVSILSLLAEGDAACASDTTIPRMFQSSPSLRRETPDRARPGAIRPVSILSLLAEGDARRRLVHKPQKPVSILSLLAEGDDTPHIRRPSHGRFNPLPPCGGRHAAERIVFHTEVFQSSPSLRRETRHKHHGGFR